MSEYTMPRVSRCDRTDSCPEPLDHDGRCPKFDSDFWSKVQVRKPETDAYQFAEWPGDDDEHDALVAAYEWDHESEYDRPI